MKGIRVLTIAICIACFLIGYLAYLGTAYIFDFLRHEAVTCQVSLELCDQESVAPEAR